MPFEASHQNYSSIPTDTISMSPNPLFKETEKSHFTWRAVFVGLIFGTLLCFSNMYFGLQTGWISMMSLQSSLVGFAVFKALEPLLKKKFSIHENVLVQTTAVAAATMPLAGGFVGILPAFNMLTDDEIGDNLLLGTDLLRLVLWGFGLSLFGVFFAILLRKQFLIKEKLRFPSGTATAEMIAVLHNKKNLEDSISDQLVDDSHSSTQPTDYIPLPITSPSDDSTIDDEYRDPQDQSTTDDPAGWKFKIYILTAAFFVSSIYTIVANIYPDINKLPIFGEYLSSVWLWNLRPSLSFAGQGIIMGLPTTSHMLIGAIVGWGILSPLAKLRGWAPGPVSDWKDGSRGWILWISLAIMISESLTSLFILVIQESYDYFYNLLNHSPQSTSSADHYNSTDKDHTTVISNRTAWIGLFISTILCAYIMEHLLLIPVKKTILAVLVACLLTVLSVRALGKTDLNPVSGIGKISQIIFAYLMPKNLIGNLVAGAIAEAGAMQAGDLMQDLKTGILVGAHPNAQFYAQFIGSLFSVFVSAYAYRLYTRLYEIPGPVFAVPTAQVWLDMARLVNGELLPPYTREFSLYFGIFFCVLVIIQKSAPILISAFNHSYHNSSTIFNIFQDFSGMAFAIGIYNTPDFTLARFFGALSVEIFIITYAKYQKSIDNIPLANYTSAKKHLMPFAIILASGFVLGEGATAFAILLFDNYF
ncbi:putative oligopeptide transporter [Smittium mucronatum]|uniref:Putative oligopeptide transporter n=1 Tax=Smittium mucronatum TaxID=133383 RepID=A0A1R0GSZ7_9FUNG|nr:putative oligopeptide transporter [Smittium mucronatum]